MKLDYLIIKLDGKGNLIKQKQKSLKYRSKGEWTDLPLNKGKYNRAEVKKELKGDEERWQKNLKDKK